MDFLEHIITEYAYSTHRHYFGAKNSLETLSPVFSSALGSSHGLSSSKPEPATIMRSWAIWSQSHNNSLAPLIYGLAHVASGSKPSRGNTNLHILAIYIVHRFHPLYSCGVCVCAYSVCHDRWRMTSVRTVQGLRCRTPPTKQIFSATFTKNRPNPAGQR